MPFELEEWQSRYETTVEYNLADSGCHPVRLSELVSDSASTDKLLALDLHYPPVGTCYTVHERLLAHPGSRRLGAIALAHNTPLICSNAPFRCSLTAHRLTALLMSTMSD